jgi:hypothetical protein
MMKKKASRPEHVRAAIGDPRAATVSEHGGRPVASIGRCPVPRKAVKNNAVGTEEKDLNVVRPCTVGGEDRRAIRNTPSC